MTTLAKETETYKRLLPSLLTEQGKFAVIHEETLIGIFQSYEDALTIGYEKCGVKQFLVKKILADENISYFSRELSNSCQV